MKKVMGKDIALDVEASDMCDGMQISGKTLVDKPTALDAEASDAIDTGEALQVEFDICVEAAAVECKAVEVLKGVAVESAEPDLLGKVAEEVEVRDQLETVCDGMPQISVKTMLGKSIALDVEASDMCNGELEDVSEDEHGMQEIEHYGELGAGGGGACHSKAKHCGRRRGRQRGQAKKEGAWCEGWAILETSELAGGMPIDAEVFVKTVTGMTFNLDVEVDVTTAAERTLHHAKVEVFVKTVTGMTSTLDEEAALSVDQIQGMNVDRTEIQGMNIKRTEIQGMNIKRKENRLHWRQLEAACLRLVLLLGFSSQAFRPG